MAIDRADINQCYRVLLGRDAEAAGMEHYLDLVEAKNITDITEITQIIMQSEEFKIKMGTGLGHDGSGSPFFHYNSLFDGQEIMRRHAAHDLIASPRHLTNFLGVRIDPEIYPPLLKGREGEIEAVPIPANWHADIAEWAAALRAVDLAGATFRVVELGCGWGCWMLNTGCAARSMGKEVHLIGIEGDQAHVGMALKSMAVNGFTPNQYEIYHGIAANESGVALFPVANDASTQWGSAPIMGEGKLARRRAVATGKFIELPVVGLKEITDKFGNVDLLHIDIQGGEFDFIQSCMKVLKSKIAYILVGTHSRQIEGQIMALMLAEGWRLEIERPALFNMNKTAPHVAVDGVQGWRNMILRPD